MLKRQYVQISLPVHAGQEDIRNTIPMRVRSLPSANLSYYVKWISSKVNKIPSLCYDPANETQ